MKFQTIDDFVAEFNTLPYIAQRKIKRRFREFLDMKSDVRFKDLTNKRIKASEYDMNCLADAYKRVVVAPFTPQTSGQQLTVL